jgi:hypothetical protein
MLQNKLSYQPDQFEIEFKQTEIYRSLSNEYEHIIFDGDFTKTEFWHAKTSTDNFFTSWSNQEYWSNRRTGRQLALDKGVVDVMPFYYLNFITKTLPDKIYDIGCGCNFFKQYIPNIIGISAERPDSKYFYGDEYGVVDELYIQQHQKFFPCAFAITSLHFVPITQIRQRVIDFMSMIKSGGVGFLVFNAWRMIEHSSPSDLDVVDDLNVYVRTQLDNMPFEYLVVDIDVVKQHDFTMIGNIRLVMKNA